MAAPCGRHPATTRSAEPQVRIGPGLPRGPSTPGMDPKDLGSSCPCGSGQMLVPQSPWQRCLR